MRQGQLTPNSISSEPRSMNPLTPSSRLTPTEDYFAPRSSSQNSLASSPRPITRPSGHNSFNSQNGNDSEPRGLSESPASLGNSTFLKRMNTIAPGPFDTTHRPSRVTTRKPIPPRKSSIGQKEDVPSVPAVDVNLQERPGTATSIKSTGSNGSAAPPRIPSRTGYEGFGPPLKSGDDLEPQPLGLINRSETFPRPSAPPEPPVRTLSTPGSRPDRTKSGLDEAKRPSMLPDTSRPPPPRKSLMRPPTAKFVGSIDLAAEFGTNNPYHTPSDSGSSGYSTFSRPSHSSSHTSPEKRKSRRQPSDTSDIDELMNDLQSSMESLRSKELPIDLPPPPPRTRSPLVESPFGMSPREEIQDLATQIGQHSPKKYDQPLPSPELSVSPRGQDTFDPAVQKAERHEPRPRGYDQPSRSPQYGTSPRDQYSFDPAVQHPRKPDLSAPVAPPARKGSRDPTASRGDCKACKLPIKGKSISSADGRLTGKYHKACFVCSTCSEPFTSAEFYVLNDKPYCEQHYHKLNGSLCGSCGRGIEGQYLEDEFEIKYHVGCFRCLDCGRSLSEGYFEVDGKSYCERDAWRRVQQPWLAGKGMTAEHDSSLHPPPRGGPRHSNGHASGQQGRHGPRPNGLGMGFPRPPYGMPTGSRLSPNMAATPRMNKRNTRLGMM